MKLRDPTSFDILQYLNNNPMGTPALITDEINKNHDYIKQQLGNLTKYGMAERVDRGVYQITQRGEIALEHKEKYPSEEFEEAILSV